MRELGCCMSEYAVHVSDETSCSNNSTIISSRPFIIPPASTPSSITCVYKSILISSTQKPLLITLTWTTPHGLALTLSFGEDPPSTLLKINTNPRFFRRLRGSKSTLLHSSNIDLFWDLSQARYHPGPEPADGFFLLITVDSEPALILGDPAHEFMAKKMIGSVAPAKFSLLSRREHFSGSNSQLYSTKARFCDRGSPHDILIRCGGEKEAGMKQSVLSVCIDKKMVIRVKKLQWNFRGNQTIFLDGLLVDLMWDVHGWFYNADSGSALFMFRTRSGLDSRLWLEEKMVHKDEDKVDFSLIICACKNT